MFGKMNVDNTANTVEVVNLRIHTTVYDHSFLHVVPTITLMDITAVLTFLSRDLLSKLQNAPRLTHPWGDELT